MRTFVALPVPETGAPHRLLLECQRALQTGNPDVKWVAPDQFHITLRFLGEVDEARLPDVENAVLKAASSVHPFEVGLRWWGAFPNLQHPRTLFVPAIDEAWGTEPRPLTLLEQRLSRRLEEAGVPLDKKPFHAHVTVGRVRSERGIEPLRKKLREFVEGGAHFTARHITLFKSDLSAQGPHYTVLLEAPLLGKAKEWEPQDNLFAPHSK